MGVDTSRRVTNNVEPLNDRQDIYRFTVAANMNLRVTLSGIGGALTGIAVSLGIAMAFWGTTSLFEALGNLNQLPPAAAAWSPNLLFGLSGLYMFLRIRT